MYAGYETCEWMDRDGNVDYETPPPGSLGQISSYDRSNTVSDSGHDGEDCIVCGILFQIDFVG